jgi:CBS domain-containing protein
MNAKCVGEIMIPLGLFPVVPYWFSLHQALAQQEDFEAKRSEHGPLPWLILVFSAQNQLLGIVGRREILKGLEPGFSPKQLGRASDIAIPLQFDITVYRLSFSEETALKRLRTQMGRPIVEFITPIESTVGYDDHPLLAIYVMINLNLSVVPVVQDGQVVGIVNAEDILRGVIGDIT